MNAETLLSGAATLILIPLVLYFSKYYWDRRRLRNYENLIRAWAREDFAINEMTEGDWRSLCAAKLSEAGFEPSKIGEMLELAVCIAQGRASQETTGRIRGFEKDDESDETEFPR